MPLRPDFVVSVDDGQVSPRLGRDAKVTWDARNDKIKESIKNTWAAAVEDGTVEGDIVYDNVTCKVPPAGDQPAIRCPDLGDVAFTVSLHGASLHRDGETNDERSYGYFVMVRGRLINTDDAALYLAPPSYGTFYRMQVVIHADGLDPDLLADRGRMRAVVRDVAAVSLWRGEREQESAPVGIAVWGRRHRRPGAALQRAPSARIPGNPPRTSRISRNKGTGA
jgi:hypothetical protein